jgi:hypothetical protein
MQIGALVERLEQEDDAGEALAALGDIVLFAEVAAMGARFEESPATYTAGAVARFAAGAGDEDWVSLIGAIERAPEPSHAFLVRALRWCLAQDAKELAGASQSRACGCGADPGPCHDAHR